RRSTVGTATEVHDHLRLLFARAGRLVCPECDLEVRPWSPVAVADRLGAELDGAALYLAFSLPLSAALTHRTLVENLRALGFVRLLAAGREIHLEDLEPGRDLTKEAPLFVVVDRVKVGSTPRARLVDAIERAYEEGEGEAVVFERGRTRPEAGTRFSRHTRCDGCGRDFPAPRPSMFSFNNPYGACPACNGFGNLLEYDPDRVVPDPRRSLKEGALDPWTKPRYAKRRDRLRERIRRAGIPWTEPWETLPAEARDALVHGGAYGGVEFEGAIPFLESLERKKYKAYIRFFLRAYQTYRRCPDCGGGRLRSEASYVRVGGRTLPEVAAWRLPRLSAWLEELGPGDAPEEVLGPILRETRRRVRLLLAVGLDYLTLDRLTRSLSGGEAQRISIANALGSPLTEGLYVLDEPTVGLHSRDTGRIVELLDDLAERGNTVVVVEHDLDVVRAADRVIELGPGSGDRGGDVVFAGTPESLQAVDTATGRWLRGDAELPERRGRPIEGTPRLVVRGAREHNLRGIDVEIPLRALTAVTGVSGSGKSTLVHDVMGRALKRRFGASSREPVGDHDAIEGAEWLTGVSVVDQSPIGKSPRSNPVTYVKAFDPIRKAFAGTPEARRRGMSIGDFSFNTADGRCPECKGDGHQRIEMHFLPDVFVTCEACRGRRYRPDVLSVKLRGASIADVLAMTVDEAIGFFRSEPRVGKGLWVLQSVGLGYLRLGQPATTLSGGESQRLKIARELATSAAPKGRGRKRGSAARGALYLLDEPTTGLHNEDVRALMRVLEELVDRGNTVVVIEHHLDVIARADWVVDLGPEGGVGGGRVVTAGRPDDVAAHETSWTGRALAARRRLEEALVG
ncbi:MAG: excinuclease ABC subunit UvrA, partial [Gemmatimonadetes bacterium]|nr:excinuclease ABC subunit UvrA [Gemmatimonadota bacterium]